MPDGEWRWTDREDPVITPSMANDFPMDPGGGIPDWAALAEAGTPRRRRALVLWGVAAALAAVAAVLALVAVLLLG